MTKSGTHRSQALDEDRGTEYTFQQLQKVSSRFSSPSVQQPCRLSEPTANTTPLIRTHARCPRASKIDWATGYTTNIIRTYRLDVRLSEEKSTDCELSLSLALSLSLCTSIQTDHHNAGRRSVEHPHASSMPHPVSHSV